MLAATRAFVELKSLKNVTANCDEENRRLRVAIDGFQKANRDLKDSRDAAILAYDKQQQIAFNNETLYIDTKRELRIEKAKKIGLAVSMPVGIIASFIAGWYIHDAIK